MVLRIRRFGDPVLRERCAPVQENDTSVRRLVREMEETLLQAQGRGLAASQVGALKKVFVYDSGYGLRAVLNPRIVHAEGEETGEEGCLSIPGVVVPVKRARKIKLECMTLSGHKITIEPGGFLSRVFQHECDHLEGILILDRCNEDERKKAFSILQEMEFSELVKGS